MARDTDKLTILWQSEGYDSLEALLEDAAFGGRLGCPAICMNVDCDYTCDMEPDQDRGWCEECRDTTLKSAMVLAGVI